MSGTRTTPLTRADIVGKAMAIADTDGLAAVTMRAIARGLGVEAMSLYHHVANKDAILDALVDAVFAEIYTPCIGEPWAAELRLRCRSGREVLTRHPWAIGLMDSRKGAGFETLRHHDAVLGSLREAGFTLEAAGAAFAVLDAYLYGFLVQELALPFSDDAGPADVAGEIVAAMPAGDLPYLHEYATERVCMPGYSFGDEFDPGLELIIDGLEQRRADLEDRT
ncbi:TetR/AcrR family transcriptional regulator [Gordonia sp. (in: high G+C Gram-positive bacteria)]|jgi:AcrR family transcriptional regulator|uniref:TetR/AcrR family transcriptional regulator n=1 Tax=Gordonia sp. (in: high G+C Gram-positive bacteria) TaxID=84139 RepID=UPI001E07CAE4|nr:TetR/AcrR family transcriptional regulator [Gordonia sp. (in: high G+C Gram-positive bacteria)]MCB1293676.1 TetR/AcrR family transcriptional regulator [Gordonia sp. (in: high G+C Gram-positive bacteria)]HMS74384.1 TetR/AcrR family transcriptional regulator [Gordonia sp. (in: high G+C Gram-positive bacteria)]HQV20674.1 TetR/AcrR family transcriptional regulator [Gordonia sp. (in: high G+C Gram-positive bacteria)]